jgi:hypothetical protein
MLTLLQHLTSLVLFPPRYTVYIHTVDANLEAMARTTKGTLRFVLPDPDIGPEKLAFLSFPPAKEYRMEAVELHDYRTDSSIIRGPSGLDIQGFTFVNHESALLGDQWFSESAAEEVYLPEVISLTKTLTGASKIAIANATFRRRLASAARNDPTQYKKATDPVTFDMKAMASDTPKGIAQVHGSSLVMFVY